MTNDNQQPIEIQNPTSTLQNEKKKNNLLVFLAMAVVGFFLVAYFAKSLLTKSPTDNKQQNNNQLTASSNTGDPFANLDSLRYKAYKMEHLNHPLLTLLKLLHPLFYAARVVIMPWDKER